MGYFINIVSKAGTPSLLQLDRFKYGDLYGFTYLKDFKEEVSEPLYSDKRIYDGDKMINLWCVGDSYLAFALDSGSKFLKNSKVKYFNWREHFPKKVDFEEGKKNVILIETVERYARRFFADSKYYSNKFTREEYLIKDEPKRGLKHGALNWKLINPLVNQNLELLLFGYELFSPFKEWKAELHKIIYGTPISDRVALSEDHTFLFYAETVDSTLTTSSFKYISEDEVDSIVHHINTIRDFYLKLGFDDVILSITPNPVTIIPAGDKRVYNELIPKIQNHPKLEMKYIDVYTKFKEHKNPRILYYKNDTHWNSIGFKIWVNEANQLLVPLYKTFLNQAVKE